jgi:hypothetical protein
MEKSGEQKLHEGIWRLCRSTRDPTRYCNKTTGARRRRFFPDEAQRRDCVKVVQHEVSCALDKDNRRRPFQCMQGWKDELL